MTFKHLRGDIYGGVTAAVVALPLALAFGVASGVGPIAGLYGAIAVGFFAAVFGGTPVQVSGPTGPMTVVMASVVALHSDRLETAFAIVFFGGALQLVFGVLRLGRYVSYTPYSVISGFMSGIGVIIVLIQLLPFLGLPTAPGGPVGALRALPDALHHVNTDALAIAVVCLAVMIFWPKRLGAYLPPPLAALIVGTLLSLTIFPRAPIIGNVPTGLPSLHWPKFPIGELPDVLQTAFVLALLGTIDSLLTSLIADSITRTHHNSNRELIGQGIGNMAAGLIGAIPGAGATMRTVINFRAGGRTPLSGALHAAILLSLVLGLGPLAERIPHAALAGILLKVGWDIIDWVHLKRLRSAPRDKVAVMFVTFALTVLVDLITAVAVGMILAGFVTARWMAEEEIKGLIARTPSDDGSFTEEERRALEPFDKQILIVSLRGWFSYASAREMTRRVGTMTGGYRAIILDMSEAGRFDTSAALAIDELVQAAKAENMICIVSGLSGEAASALNALHVLKGVDSADMAPTRIEAIRRAGTRLKP
jgi:sulfate permease, SulP family